VGWQARQDVFEISIRVVAVEFGGLDQAGDRGRTLAGKQGTGE